MGNLQRISYTLEVWKINMKTERSKEKAPDGASLSKKNMTKPKAYYAYAQS